MEKPAHGDQLVLAKDEWRETAMHIAARQGDLVSASLMLKTKAGPGVLVMKNEKGKRKTNCKATGI